jgi:hypothetical protein
MLTRKGCVQVATLPAGVVHFLFYSHVLDKWFVAVGNQLYVRPGNLSGAWVSHVTKTAETRWAMVDFAALAVISFWDHNTGAKDVLTTDGTTATARGGGVAGGRSLTVFKNRVWATGYDDILGVTVPRVYFSAVGDATTWTTTTDFVDIREKDGKMPICFGAAAAGGLLLFKKDSAYKITDPATGAYQTIDWASGCMGPRAVAVLRGLTYTWGRDGLYAWDGTGRAVIVGDKLRPRFVQASLTEAARYAIAAGTHQDRIFFAYPQTGTLNTHFLEMQPADTVRADYLPAAGWIMEHELAQLGKRQIACFAVKGDELYAVLDDGDVMYRMLSDAPGADDGVGFEARYKTPPLTLGKLTRPERIRIYGRATPNSYANVKATYATYAALKAAVSSYEQILLVYPTTFTPVKQFRTYKDWSTRVYETFDLTVDLQTRGGREDVVDLFSLDHAEAHQFEFRTYGGTDAEFARLLVDLTELER